MGEENMIKGKLVNIHRKIKEPIIEINEVLCDKGRCVWL